MKFTDESKINLNSQPRLENYKEVNSHSVVKESNNNKKLLTTLSSSSPKNNESVEHLAQQGT